jgi:hypothetical protein
LYRSKRFQSSATDVTGKNLPVENVQWMHTKYTDWPLYYCTVCVMWWSVKGLYWSIGLGLFHFLVYLCWILDVVVIALWNI